MIYYKVAAYPAFAQGFVSFVFIAALNLAGAILLLVRIPPVFIRSDSQPITVSNTLHFQLFVFPQRVPHREHRL
jgi:hypothetical protein